MPIDLIIYIVVAAVMVIWLRNTLGARHGEERDRSDIIDQLRERQKLQEQKAQELTPHDRSGLGRLVDISTQTDMASQPTLDGVPIEGGAETVQEVLAFMQNDVRFDPKAFLSGAKDAFPMIVEAFARGDLPTLKMLLSDGVYTMFEQAIEDRRTRGETLITDVHAVKGCSIMGIKTIQRMVYIKLRFLAEESVCLRDRDGMVISGHPDKVVTMNDVWTFGRDTRSKDPTWHLYETSDDVIDEFKNPVPDAT